MSYNVITSRQQAPQVIIDQATLQQMQVDLTKRIADLERLRIVIETLSQTNDPERFQSSAMAFCNQLAARWSLERASLGFLKGRYVRLKALSHTEKFTRQMRIVQDLEASMEECLDQDVEVIYPAPAQATYVSRATEKLANTHGPNVVCSVPLRRDKKVVAVVTLERKAERPFAAEEIETLRLACDLVTPRMVELYESDKWFGARLAASARKSLALAIGPKHTWAKVTALAVMGVILFMVLVPGTYRVDAPFTLEAREKQVIFAPWDGYLKSVRVMPGDWVLSTGSSRRLRAFGAMLYPFPNIFAAPMYDSTLAELDTAELRNRMLTSMSERESYLKQVDIARRDGKEAEAQVNQANADKSDADVRNYQWQIDQANLQSPVDGVVFTGDLKQKLGAKVSAGDPLFEVGRQEDLRAELSVREDEVADVRVGQHGRLKAASYPDRTIGFTVENIYPVAEVVKQNNVFKVRVRIDDRELQPWMRPGMEGVAKVDAGEARYGWIWTRRLINWIRMKLWI